MIKNHKKVIYSLVVVLLNLTIILFTILNITNWVSTDNIIFLFVISKDLWLLSLVTLLFHIKKLFSWLYIKISSRFIHGSPELFATSQYLLPEDKSYGRLKYITVILLLISAVIEIILFVIK